MLESMFEFYAKNALILTVIFNQIITMLIIITKEGN